MLKIDFYIIRVILKPFLATLLVLVGMVWLLQSIRLIDLVINKNMSFIDFGLMSILLIPGMLIVLLPLSFFSGVYAGLKKMVLDSEMDAIYSAGISRVRILKPLFIMSLFVTGLTYFISLYAMPTGRMVFADIKNELRNKADSLQLEAGTFNKVSSDVTIYVKVIENNQWMKNIIVYDNSNAEMPVTWTAEEGVLKLNKNNKPNLFLLNGTRQEITDSQTSVLGFKSHQIDLSGGANKRKHRARKSAERFLLELLDTEGLSEKQQNKFKAEFYKRLLWPLAPIVLMLIPLYFLFKPVKNRFGITKPSIFAIVVAVGFIIVQMFLNSQISSGKSNFVWVSIIWPIITSIFFLAIIAKQKCR